MAYFMWLTALPAKPATQDPVDRPTAVLTAFIEHLTLED